MKLENLKFKAKSIEDFNLNFPKGSWVTGNFRRSDNNRYFISHPLAVNEDGEPIIYSATEVDPKTICMFTGFYDKNGKEIWEGDILERTQSYVRFTVMFNRSAFFIRRNGTVNTDIYLFELSEKDKRLTFYEVIGNNFDIDDSLESLYKTKKQ